MSKLNIKLLAILIILFLLTSGTLGCFSSDEPKKDEKRKGFDQENLEKTIPTTEYIGELPSETKPIANTSIFKTISNVIVVWYFEKNTIYQEYGGLLKFFIQNNGTTNIFIYQIGIKLDWGPRTSADFRGASADVGKYIEPSEQRYIGMLNFNGPKNSGEYQYQLMFSLLLQNETGAWNDCGLQEASAKSFQVVTPPSVKEYKQHYNLPQYYDKINSLIEPTNIEIINVSRTIAANYSGAFNIYQVCALFDYMNFNVKYFSDPSSTENYWCTPEQTLKFGGDCEDHSTLLGSMIISLGGSVQMYMTDSHAFLGLYIGSNEDAEEILVGIREYYGTDLNIFWLSDSHGNWLILDSIGSEYPGGLPLGGEPTKISSEGVNDSEPTEEWTWGFTQTDNLYVTDLIPK